MSYFIVSLMFYSCSTQRSLLYPSPWYNRNGWLGVKHQVTYCTLKLRGYNRVEITGLSARLGFVQILGLIQVLAFLVFIVVNRVRVKRAVFISPSLFSSVIFVKNYSILSLNRRFNRLQAWANLIGTVDASSSFGASCKKIVFKSKGHFRARQVLFIPVA